MNQREALDMLGGAHAALTRAWEAEPSRSRRARLRSLLLKIELESRVIAGRAKAADPCGAYTLVAGNFTMAASDLKWVRNRAGSLAASAIDRARIAAFGTTILNRL